MSQKYSCKNCNHLIECRDEQRLYADGICGSFVPNEACDIKQCAHCGKLVQWWTKKRYNYFCETCLPIVEQIEAAMQPRMNMEVCHSCNREIKDGEFVERAGGLQYCRQCSMNMFINHKFNQIKSHMGHKIVVAVYGNHKYEDNVAIECVDCNEVLYDVDWKEWKEGDEYED